MYKFELKSKDTFLNLKDFKLSQYERVYLKDSIFNFYPFAEVYFKDLSGIIAEHAFFVEGLVINTVLGFDTEDYINHDFIWSENQLNDSKPTGFISGTNVFVLMSAFYKNNNPQSRAFIQKTISSVIQEIVRTDLKIIDPDKIKISTTTSPDNWYQCGENLREFIINLTDRAVSVVSSDSPIMSFINLDGTFFFKSIEELFLSQPVAEYTLDLTLDQAAKIDVIQDFQLLHGGIPVNKENYLKKGIKINSGEFESENSPIEDHCYKEKGVGKFLVNKADTQEYSDIIDFGIYENKDKDNYKGFVNSFFKNSALSYRMEVIVHTREGIVSGNTVKLNIKSSDETKFINFKMSGMWLIVSSEHYIDEDEAPYSRLLLAKSTIPIDTLHKYYTEFL